MDRQQNRQEAKDEHSDNAKRVGCHTGLRNNDHFAWDTRASCLAGNPLGEPFQVERPALIALDAIACAFPTLAMSFEVAVLKLQSCPAWRFGDEAHFPLTRLVGVGFDLPARADVPA